MPNQTKFIFIPLQAHERFHQAVLQWEANNTDLQAIIVGTWKSSTLTELSENSYIIGSRGEPIKETVCAIAFQSQDCEKILVLHGFCLVVDYEQLPPETWAQIPLIGGQIFDEANDYKTFEQSLQSQP